MKGYLTRIYCDLFGKKSIFAIVARSTVCNSTVIKKKIRKIRMILIYKTHFDIQILALFDKAVELGKVSGDAFE